MAKRKRKRNKGMPKPNPVKRNQKAAASGGNFLLDCVMPIYGDWNLAEKALPALYAAIDKLGAEQRVRVIVVDNGSPDFQMEDGSIIAPAAQANAVIEILRPTDIFMRLDINQGFPGGVNAGFARGRAPLICVVSADTVLHEDSLGYMIRDFDDPSTGVVGIKLIFSDDSHADFAGKTQHAGHAIAIDGKVKHVFLGWSADHPKVNRRREMASVTGAVFMTRRSIFDQVGGFDAAYTKGTYEDVDFCFKARTLGAKVIYNPLATATHKAGGSITDGAAKEEGFPLTINEQIFKSRWLKGLAWDEWRYV